MRHSKRAAGARIRGAVSNPIRRTARLVKGFGESPRRIVSGTVLEDFLDTVPGLYHVTTNLPSVLKEGLKSRKTLRQSGKVAGLGGGGDDVAPDRISVTVSLPRALFLMAVVRMMADAVHGRLQPEAALSAFNKFYQFQLESLEEAGYFSDDTEDHTFNRTCREKSEKAVRSARNGIQLYDALKKLEALLVEIWHEYSKDEMPEHNFVVFTMYGDEFVHVDPEKIGLVKVAVSRDAVVEIEASELELRLRPQDVQVVGYWYSKPTKRSRR